MLFGFGFFSACGKAGLKMSRKRKLSWMGLLLGYYIYCFGFGVLVDFVDFSVLRVLAQQEPHRLLITSFFFGSKPQVPGD